MKEIDSELANIKAEILRLHERNWTALAKTDEKLIDDLYKRQAKTAHGPDDLYLRNQSINASEGISNLISLLNENAAFKIKTETHSLEDKDGEEISVVVTRAAVTDMWPMGTGCWIRDLTLVGVRILTLVNAGSNIAGFSHLEARELFMSASRLMSTLPQLERFKGVIKSKDQDFISHKYNWPHIFLDIKGNLNGAKQESWSHKQDAWQMTAYYLIDALERGWINEQDCSEKQIQFLGLISPFLAKVKFYQSPNSGSWEELESIRSSVIAWETALLWQIRNCRLDWLKKKLAEAFNTHHQYISELVPSNFEHALDQLIKMGTDTLKKMLPFESPLEEKGSPGYREADSTLYYHLDLNIPEMLYGDSKEARKLEDQILKQLLSLKDPVTGGMYRYHGDSYQRLGFFRNQVVAGLSALYGGPSADASDDFVGRDKIVPRGPEAAWTHPLWQISAWAGRKARNAKDKELVSYYRKIQHDYFRRGLGTITAENEVSIEQPEASKQMALTAIAAFRFPECYIYDQAKDGTIFPFPSPHTPLNWATAEAMMAFYEMGLL